ncbi:hypothetical protein BOX15_Mlig019523g3 [Macrostomum lignano]|uniref:PID domain-containing protein n=1 Tax=Macrostomum lignano TaxID=282301 RepID=A0A267FYC0_9PLAT|nr:hypothetical protein BOX15_Mlig019523g3 [Macrostomum lignano]
MSEGHLEPEAADDIDEDEYFNEFLLAESSPAESVQGAASAASEQLKDSAEVTLPTVSVVKRLGFAPAAGIGGSDSVRGPVDQLAKAVARLRRSSQASGKLATQLPRVQLTVLPHGLSVEDQESGSSTFHPIETISYVAMETRMPRLFCLVSVEIAVKSSAVQQQQQQQQQPARTVAMNPTCHVFLCASVSDCHSLVLAARLAFSSSVNQTKAAALAARRKQQQQQQQQQRLEQKQQSEAGDALSRRVVKLGAVTNEIEEA